MSTNSIYFFSVPMERFELSIVRVLRPLRMPIPPHRYLGWMMGIEPTHNAPQAFALPLGYIQHMQFHKDLNPNFFIRSERCYPLHHRTICTPLQTRTVIIGFGDRYASHCTKEMCVGIERLELSTPAVSERCANQLRHIPMCRVSRIRTCVLFVPNEAR